METLTLGADGPQLERPSTVGWVYWGRLFHLARSKVRTFVDGRGGQVRGEMEQRVLGQIGCTANQHEGLNTAASRRDGCGDAGRARGGRPDRGRRGRPRRSLPNWSPGCGWRASGPSWQDGGPASSPLRSRAARAASNWRARCPIPGCASAR